MALFTFGSYFQQKLALSKHLKFLKVHPLFLTLWKVFKSMKLWDSGILDGVVSLEPCHSSRIKYNCPFRFFYSGVNFQPPTSDVLIDVKKLRPLSTWSQKRFDGEPTPLLRIGVRIQSPDSCDRKPPVLQWEFCKSMVVKVGGYLLQNSKWWHWCIRK